MKKVIVFLLVAAGLLFGAKFVLEKRYKSKIDDGLDQVRAFVNIRYDAVKIDWDGSIALEEVIVRLADGMRLFSATEIKAVTSNKLFLINGDKELKNGNYPEWVQLSVTGMAIEASYFEKEHPEQCVSLMSAMVYSEIGEDPIVGNIEIKADFDEDDGIDMRMLIEDPALVSEITASYSIEQIMSAVGQPMQMPFDEFSFRSEMNESTAEQFNEYCATKHGLTVDKYLSEFVVDPRFMVKSFDFDLGVDARQALATYLKGGSELKISSQPSKLLGSADAWQLYEPSDLIRMLNLAITIDGEYVVINPVVDQSTEASNTDSIDDEPENTLTTIEADREEINELPVTNGAEPKSVTKKAPPSSLQFQKVPIKQISNYVGDVVRIKRKNNKSSMDGILLRYEGGRLSVEIKRHTGKMIYSIRPSEIESIEVYK